jgi:translation initiation factor IF-2
MSETQNSLKFIKNIKAIEAKYSAKLLQSIDEQKKQLEKALMTVYEKRAILHQQFLAEEEKRLQREQAIREKEEALKKAAQEPLEIETDKPKKPTKTKKTQDEATVEVKPEEVKTEEVAAKPAEAVAEEVAPKQPSKPAVDKDMVDAILAPIFKTPQKTVVEKPVIRVYIPPAETPRVRRDPSQTGTGPRPPFNRPTGQAPAGGAQRPPFAGGMTRPMLPTAPIAASPKAKKVGDRPLFDQKKTMDKKTLAKKGYIENTALVEYDEISGEIKKIRTRKTASGKHGADFFQPANIVIDHAIITKEFFTIKELSEKIGKTGVEIIKKLFILGIIKTINDNINFETAELVASELGVTLELQRASTSEENLLASHEEELDDPALLITRPPIVTIMGHVDHGKTSILDYIRKANVAAGEAGGITQHIGAYSIDVNPTNKITFLDTPGHAAFTAMRARGANVTDIAVIVVAADDGIMPQTVEAINHCKAAGVSIVVAVNKMDKKTADPDRILSQLSENGLVVEDWGGTVPMVKVSAKTGDGIQNLLETILVTAEVSDYKANPKRNAKGTIIEANLDKGKGPMATVLVQNGTLKVGDFVVAGSVFGKIRAMQDSKGKSLKIAEPSIAVSILGLQEVPSAGDQLMVVESEKLMKQVAQERAVKEQEKRINTRRVTLDDVFKGLAEGKLKSLNLILKADVQGSVEALRDALIKLTNDEVKVSIVHAVAGAINESDVTLADTTNSIIIGFNVRPDVNAKALAEKNAIDIRLYRVIYDALDDVEKAIKGMLAPVFREQYLGKAEVRAVFKVSSLGNIAGCMVKDGKICRAAKARVIRNNIIVGETEISSLKRMKDDAKEVLQGFECGIGLHNYNDIKEGDIIESFNIVQEKV